MPTAFGALTDDDLADIEKRREWVRGHFEENADSEYQRLGNKLVLLKTIVTQRWIEPHEIWKLQSLGVTFGDALVQQLGLRWIVVNDEYGRVPALRDGDTSLTLFPLTSISKRVERGESVDPLELFKEACRSVEAARAELRAG